MDDDEIRNMIDFGSDEDTSEDLTEASAEEIAEETVIFEPENEVTDETMVFEPIGKKQEEAYIDDTFEYADEDITDDTVTEDSIMLDYEDRDAGDTIAFEAENVSDTMTFERTGETAEEDSVTEETTVFKPVNVDPKDETEYEDEDEDEGETNSGILDFNADEEANKLAFKDETEDEIPHVDFNGDRGKHSKGKLIKWIVIAVLAAVAVVIFIRTDTGIIGAYKTNFAHNFQKLFGITLPYAQDESAADETAAETTAEENLPIEEEVQRAIDEANGIYTEETADDAEASENFAESSSADLSVETSANGEIEYITEPELSKIIPYEYANTSQYSSYRDGVVCAATNYLCYFNADGEMEWEQTTSVISPILKTAGDYILIAQTDGVRFSMYNKNELMYDNDCENNIENAFVSENGDCVLVTERDLYKGAIEAYNKSGKKVYAWVSGTDSIIAAAISPKSRNIAAALLNTDDAVSSAVSVFDIATENAQSTTSFADTVLYDISCVGNNITVFGDNSLIGMDSKGNTDYNIRYEGASVEHYGFDDDGNKVMLIDNNNIPTLIAYGSGSRERGRVTPDSMPDYVDILSNRVIYNVGRDVIIYKLGAKKAYKHAASMDIRGIIMLDKKSFFIVYSNSLELVRF